MTPLIVEVRRDGVLEAVHRVHAVAVRDGAVVREAGDAGLTCFMRSSSKPLQALPLVRARDDLTHEDIAIACASHRATEEQLDAARALLKKANASEDDFELGLQEGRPPHKIYNNCSGKHAGMLALCDVNNWPKRGYHESQHPVQQACAEAHAEAAQTDQAELATGNDGCGVVTFAMPLERMALAFANLPTLPHAQRITQAMRAKPHLVGGADGADVLLMQHPDPSRQLVAKGGAEGLLCGVLSDATGFAIKSADGAGRALGPSAAAFLARLGADVPRLYELPVANSRGENVGAIRVE